MNKNDIISKINNFLIDEFEIEEELIAPQSTWKDIGIDSLDFIDIVVVVENVFGLTIKGEDMANVKSLQDFYDFIEARLNA